jgi:adenosylcobinamide-GDP ribazoletransferase
MKKYLYAFVMCQSMFCAIPAPQAWDEKAKDKMLLFLPVVGLEIGAIWAALAWLCRLLNLPALVAGLVLCAYPFLITGFIHLDGFMDVTDAVKSWRDLERRREILKDSHVGSFAVIGIVLLAIAQFAFFSSAPTEANDWILIFVPAVSRCCSSLAVTGLKPMSTSQYADQKKPKSHIVALSMTLCLFLAAGFLLCGKYGFVLIGCLAGYGLALLRAYRSLDGMNGDISGYALTVSELCAVAVYALI